MILSSVVRHLRPVTDLFAPYAFNRMGFMMNRRGFDPADLPEDGGGRTALVTGANSGIGFATARELARRRFEVWLLCRDATRGEQARDAIVREHAEARVHVSVVDMASLASIRRFAGELAPVRVDVLVHNAGVLPAEKTVTGDGVELTFATSVVGPFALSCLLFPRLSRSEDARVIFVASGGLYLQRLDLALLDVTPARFDGTRAYANAKRAQVILAHTFAERCAGRAVTFASMHPGWADTAAVRSSLPKFHAVMGPWLRSAEQGADTVVWLASSPAPRSTPGRFWFDRRVVPEYLLPWTRESPSARVELLHRCEAMGGVSLESALASAAVLP